MELTRSTKHRYLVALGATLGALLLRFLLDPFLGGMLPFYVFYFSVLIATAHGGYGPGVFTLVTGFLLGLFFFALPRYSFSLDDGTNMLKALRFLVVSAFMVFIAGRLQAKLVLHRRNLANAWRAESACRQEQRITQQERSVEVERVKRFLSVTAKELRTPMVPAVDPLLLLERSGCDAVQATELLHAHRGRSMQFVERLERLMDLGRIERTRGALDLRAVDLRRIIDQAVARNRSSERAPDVNIDVPLDPLHVYGDALRLRQVIEDVLDHLHGSTGGARLSVRLHHENDTAVVVVRPVLEAGPASIPEEEALPDLLVLARRITERHRGTLHVQRTGGLSEVVLRLPVMAAPDVVMAPALPNRKAVAEDRTGPVRVLICSEDAPFAEPLSTLLNAQGHAAFIARDLRDVRTLATTGRPDVVLIDLSTRAAEGRHLARTLQLTDHGEAPLLIAGTAHAEEEGNDRVGQGFNAWVPKPAALD